MPINTKIVHSFCGGWSLNRSLCYLSKDLYLHIFYALWVGFCCFIHFSSILFTISFNFWWIYCLFCAIFYIFCIVFVLSLIWSRGVGMSDFLWKYSFPWWINSFMHFYRHWNSPFTGFLHSFHEILCFTALFDRNFELYTNHSPGHMTMKSHPKWKSTDRLKENIHFLCEYIYSRFATDRLKENIHFLCEYIYSRFLQSFSILCCVLLFQSIIISIFNANFIA